MARIFPPANPVLCLYVRRYTTTNTQEMLKAAAGAGSVEKAMKQMPGFVRLVVL